MDNLSRVSCSKGMDNHNPWVMGNNPWVMGSRISQVDTGRHRELFKVLMC